MPETDDYYRQQRLQRAAEAESAAENARAARMGALDEALRAVLRDDTDVIDEAEFATLSDAAGIVSRLHAIW